MDACARVDEKPAGHRLVDRRGPAQPLVLLPGMGCSKDLWARTIDDLPENLPVIQPGLEGDELDAVVAGLLHSLPDRFALAGLSLGGNVAMALVRTAPERVSRLLLASTNPHAPTDQQLRSWTEQLERLAGGTRAADLQRELLPVLLRPHAPAALADRVVAMAEQVGDARLARQLRLQRTRIDERPGLRAVRVPTVVLAATDDVLCPVARHEEVHQLVPGSRLVVLAETAHLSPMERPREVARVLCDWLA